MSEIQELVAWYRFFGLGVAVILPGEKVPRYRGWNLRSRDPEDFDVESNLGILTGTLSNNLVCVDIDAATALTLADQFLPPTGMVEGRPGRLASHRYYEVTAIPPGLTAPMTSAAGLLLGGPRTVQYRHPDGRMLLEILGTGRHAVAPPSAHPSGEARSWEQFRDPAILPCTDLYGFAARLALACGWHPRAYVPQAGPPVGAAGERVYLENLPAMPVRARRARAYISRVPGAIEGQGGSARTVRVACLLVRDFALDLENAWDLLLEYNLRCAPPWSTGELQRRLIYADNFAGERGQRLFWERPDAPPPASMA